jgi:circadian clock protein KaiB
MAAPSKTYVLRLYVTHATPKSARAIVNTRRLLEQHLAGLYSLEILDIAEHVVQATRDQIVCAPTLLRVAPLPARRIIGDMADETRVLKALDVPLAAC